MNALGPVRPNRRLALMLGFVASSLVAIAVVGLWITTQFRTLNVVRMVIESEPRGSTNTKHMLTAAPPGLLVDHISGTLIYRQSISDAPPHQPPHTNFSAWPSHRASWRQQPKPNRFSFLGIGINRDHQSTPWTGPENIQTRIDTRTTVYLPWWFLIALTAWPGLVWIGHRIRTRPARRQARGLCRKCAYDLAGLDTGACPECGQSVPIAQFPLPKADPAPASRPDDR